MNINNYFISEAYSKEFFDRAKEKYKDDPQNLSAILRQMNDQNKSEGKPTYYEDEQQKAQKQTQFSNSNPGSSTGTPYGSSYSKSRFNVNNNSLKNLHVATGITAAGMLYHSLHSKKEQKYNNKILRNLGIGGLAAGSAAALLLRHLRKKKLKNKVVTESLSEHFKKHGKKYLLGLAAATALSGKTYYDHEKLKATNRRSKLLANMSAINDASTSAMLDRTGSPEFSATVGGINGLIQHHAGRKIVDAIIDRKSNRHWWNAGKRAKQKNTINNIAAGINSIHNLYQVVRR